MTPKHVKELRFWYETERSISSGTAHAIQKQLRDFLRVLLFYPVIVWTVSFAMSVLNDAQIAGQQEQIEIARVGDTLAPDFRNREEIESAERQVASAKEHLLVVRAAIVFNIVFASSICLLTVSAANRRLRRFQSEVRKNRLTTASLEKTPVLLAFLANCREQLGVAGPMSVWISRTAASPSVIESDGNAHVIVPMGFLTLIRRDPGKARVILTHELAHVLHRDSHLWLISYAFSTPLMWLVVPSLILLIITNSIVGSSLWGLVMGLYNLNQVRSLRKTVIAGRRRSEQLADFVSMLFAGVGPTVATLGLLDGRESVLHPSRADRISFLHELAQQFGLSAADHIDAAYFQAIQKHIRANMSVVEQAERYLQPWPPRSFWSWFWLWSR